MKQKFKHLHKLEMELVNLCEDNEVMKEAIIERFTNLMNRWNR